MRAMENAETGLHMEALGQQGGSSTKEKKSKSEPAKDVVRHPSCFDRNWNIMDDFEQMHIWLLDMTGPSRGIVC